MQTQTKDALTRLFSEGFRLFGSVKDIRGSPETTGDWKFSGYYGNSFCLRASGKHFQSKAYSGATGATFPLILLTVCLNSLPL